MPYKLVWDTDTVLHCRFFGAVNFDQVNAASDEFFNDPRSDKAMHAVWDFLDMESFDISKEDASEIAATDYSASCYLKPLNAAFITDDPKFTELVKHYIAEMDQFGTHWTNKQFSNIEDAMDWIAETA